MGIHSPDFSPVGTTVATANAISPSSLPVNPIFSLVVALILTSSGRTPRACASISRIFPACGEIFGRSATIVKSA